MSMQESGQMRPELRGGCAGTNQVRLARRALLWAVAGSLALVLVPRLLPALSWLAWPQILMGTLAHELGHGLAALSVGGGLESLRLYPDGSGVALTHAPGGALSRAWIAAGGLFGPPLAGAMLFIGARRAELARVLLALVAIGLVLALACWVRNAFGWLWVGSCIVLMGWVGLRWSAAAAQAFTCFLAVQCCLASLARIDYLFASQARTGAGELVSDTAQMAAVLGGPHWFWGGLVLLVSLGAMGIGLWWFLRALRRARAPHAR